MNKKKIINDPVYGFISIPYDIVYDLIEHPWFQRLRRIKQLGLTHYVYPGAMHSRFHHALGAMHLMLEAISVLRNKGIDITEEERQAAAIAILLHDIGHGPFSHSLEQVLINAHHEEITLQMMQALNQSFSEKLNLAIQIYRNKHPKSFLNQLVTGQLDMDRMDYLNRDSFYTGVVEGKIGSERIIKMLNVLDDQLVVEEKGIHSIEKFLLARSLMYLQVYLHKAVLSAEWMLKLALERIRYLMIEDRISGPPNIHNLLVNHRKLHIADLIEFFVEIDDTDIISLLKAGTRNEDKILKFLCNGLINRKLFRVVLSKNPFSKKAVFEKLNEISHRFDLDQEEAKFLFCHKSENVKIYDKKYEGIFVLPKNSKPVDYTEISDFQYANNEITKYFLCYPR